MARSGAERQQTYRLRQWEEQRQLRQRVHDLEGELAAAHARIAELERALSKAATPTARKDRRLAKYLYPSPRRP
jgi:hypothetical protein